MPIPSTNRRRELDQSKGPNCPTSSITLLWLCITSTRPRSMRWGESSDPFDSGGSAMIQVSVGGDRTGPATATRRPVTLLFIEDSDTEASRFVALLEQAAPAGFDMARVTTVAEATSHLQANAT